jgi:hypothetical protein
VENDVGGSAATFTAAREPPDQLDEWGLSQYTLRELANWYEDEANRRRVGIKLDQKALHRDLRKLLAEHGVIPEFIAAEFERVMQTVFAVEE